MEAVPKLPLISFELKVSTDHSLFSSKLKQYIVDAYREDADSFGNDIHRLEGLRAAAVRATIDSKGLKGLIRYFCQLRAIQSRFPMGKGQPAACTFAWKDLYANISCSLADIKFEMACILYNIGALHTQLGSSEPRTSADSLKAACQHYQHAAWAFQFLSEQYPQPPGADISTEILKLLQEICFAQAQECILDKSIQDTRKPSVIGSVATQVMYFYKNSLAHLGPSTGTDNIHEIIGTKLYNYWHRYLSFKVFYISCIVCLYQGMHAEEQQKMGERVAFYQQAVDKLAEARKLSKYIEPAQITQEALTFTNDFVEGKRKAAKNENEFIYHEEVPDKDMLSDLKPVCLVSAVAIDLNDPETIGPDLFSRLVPMVAHEASSLYSEEKAKLLRHIGSLVDAKNTELTEFMSSLQLDQLDVLDSDQKIPQEIVDRCAAMNAKGEIIPILVDSMNSLAEVISDVEHSLDEIKNLIQEETMKEKEYQKQMGPRPPSIVQTEISREYHKYQEAHARTNESNQVLHKAMTLHIANLRLLSQPLHVLQSKIPSIDNIEGLDRETMKEMRYVVSKAREMQVQRDALMQQLRADAAADDVTRVLLARPGVPLDDVFKQELEKHTPTVKIIEQNLAAQENIINKLTSLYASYGESRRLLADVLRKREGLINALITSYDTHAELLGKSQKGLEFYRKLAHSAAALAARARAVCQVQREERALATAQRVSTPSAAPASASRSETAKVLDTVPPPSSGGTLKLKDYLPYMKNRSLGRNQLPQAPTESLPSEGYYPETIYPTSVRPTPVGSEATELTQPMPDGVVMPQGMSMMQNPYSRQYTPYAPTESDSYNPQASYAFPMTKYSKPEENYSYSSYTPPQFSGQMPDPQTYTNPYYSATQNNSTAVTDSQNNPYANMNQNPNPNQYNVANEQYVVNQMDPNTQFNQVNQDFNASFAQMNISAKPEPTNNYGGDYAQTHYVVQYPQSHTPNMATYSSAGQNSNTNIVESPLPTGNSMNYPYTTDPMSPYGQTNVIQGQNVQDQQPSTAYSVSNPMQNMQNPTQNIANSMQNVPNSMQNFPNSMPNVMQSIPNSMQAGVHSMQNVPNSMQNIQSSIQNVSTPSQNVANPMQNMQNPMQNVQSPMQNVPPNQIQNMQNPMQNVQSSMQNVPPNLIQNMQNPNMSYSMPGTSMQNVPNTANFSNPMQSVQNSIPSSIPNSNAIPSMSGYNTDQQYSYSLAYDTVSQSYIYTNAENPAVTTTSNSHAYSAGQTYGTIPDANSYDQHLSQLDAMDKPIKSHVTGQALTSNIPNYQSYNPQTPMNYPDQTPQQTNTQFSDKNNYGQMYQNHPGYTFNATSGNYDYTYGSQNTYSNYGQGNVDQNVGKDQNWSAPGMYTSAGACETVQSPSETPQMSSDNNAIYYNLPYGYLTATNQANEIVTQSVQITTNYGANMNNSTYMQSGQIQDTSVTFASSQVSNAKENVAEQSGYANNNQPHITNQSTQNVTVSPSQSNVEPSQNYQVSTKQNNQSSVESNQNYQSNVGNNQNYQSTVIANSNQNDVTQNDQSNVPNQTAVDNTQNELAETEPSGSKSENIEQSTFDLLSEIDFSVEQKPLMPEIKVPQISEKAIFKPAVIPKIETVKPVPKEEVIERPPRKDIFSDPSLLNQFTQEVKNLQKLTDSLTNKTPSGLTVLDAKWKYFQDIQAKENVNRSKSFAMRHSSGSLVAEVVPYDSSRLTLKSDPDAYINASYYKQLASWCVPLVISKCPEEAEYTIFWKAMLENKIACIVCLLSEIEMQGKAYWPTAKGQCIELGALRVTLDEVACTVHCTERRLTLALGNIAAKVVHYQINVYPAKVVCPPLVALADAALRAAGWAGGVGVGVSGGVDGVGVGNVGVGSGVDSVGVGNVGVGSGVDSVGVGNVGVGGVCVQCVAGAGRSAAFALLLLALCQVRAGDMRLCDMLDAACINLYKQRTNVLEDTKYLADAYRTVLYYAQGVLCSGTTMFNGEAVSGASGASVRAPVTPSPTASTTSNKSKFSKESFEEMRQAPGLKSGDMKDPLNFLDPLWSLKKK